MNIFWWKSLKKRSCLTKSEIGYATTNPILTTHRREPRNGPKCGLKLSTDWDCSKQRLQSNISLCHLWKRHLILFWGTWEKMS